VGKQFIVLAIVGVGTIVGFASAQAGGLAVDVAGNLFVADGHSVFKYTPDGTKSSFATGLKFPLGLCFDGKGNLFVSDGAVTAANSERSILKFSSDGKKSTFATGISSVGLAFDRSGNLLVSQGDSVLKFTPDGTKRTFVSGLGNPIDVAVDGGGNLFVADMAEWDASLGRAVFKFRPDGKKSTVATHLKSPDALTADAAGNVYISEVTAPDHSSHAILKFSPDGGKSTLSSALGRNGVSALAVDHSGNVFIWNGRAVLKTDSSGTLTTLASQPVPAEKQPEDAELFADYLKYSREVAAKQHLIVHAHLEPLSAKGKPIEFRYDRYPDVERLQLPAPSNASYVRKKGRSWIKSDDWGKTGKPAPKSATKDFANWIGLIDAPLQNIQSSRDPSQGGTKIVRVENDETASADEIRFVVTREHPTGLNYPHFAFTTFGDKALLKYFGGTMRLGDEKLDASIGYEFMFLVNIEDVKITTPKPKP
jgi:sugar lactone lactonase YvrE